ncbi:glycosyltransferase family 4 protein [Streptomyces sp. NPDC059922]|uniref:glycosyltransferase family 4 protein n=1 Tax=Streptomyces sp. NPDC059922 TaxID=3347005 RepID=UPI003664A2B5
MRTKRLPAMAIRPEAPRSPVVRGKGDQPRVIVALHEGVYGASSGTGFSNRAFLTALARLLPVGRLAVVTPYVPQSACDRDTQWTAEVQQMLQQAEAEIITIPDGHLLPKSVQGCEQLCDLVAEAAVRIADHSGRCLLIGLDVPFLGLAPYTPPTMELLLVPRSTAALTQPQDRIRVRWEKAGLWAAVAHGGRIGAISSHMRGHLTVSCALRRDSIVDIPNGLILEETGKPSAVLPLPFRARGGFLLAMGRPVPTKGFEDLLKALHILRDQGVRLPHVLLAAATPDESDELTPYQTRLAADIREYELDATLITRFSPSIRSWLHSPALRAVVVPSREEPFGRIPLEAFAAGACPVVATAAGGLAQTVIEGETGFASAPGDPASLAAAIRRALTVMPRQRTRLIKAGTALLRSRHNYEASIGSALSRITPWALAPTSAAESGSR